MIETWANETKLKNLASVFGDLIEKAVANALVHLHAQRRTHNALVNLAVLVRHWEDQLKDGQQKLLFPRDKIEEAKGLIKLVADHDAVYMVDGVLKNLCENAKHWAHHVGQQVIIELVGTATDKMELVMDIRERYAIIHHQIHMIQDEDDFSEDEMRDRLEKLANDIAAQIKIDPDFDFKNNIVPHNSGSSQEDSPKPVMSVADRVDEVFFPEKTEPESENETESEVRP